MVCASPAYLARHGTPRTPADLASHTCLDFLHWRHDARWRLAQSEDAEVSAAPACRMRSNSGEALRQAALSGLGIVMQAEVMLAEAVADGRLVPILQDYRTPPRPMHLIYPRDRQSTPKLASFVEFVVARFGL